MLRAMKVGGGGGGGECGKWWGAGAGVGAPRLVW